MTQAKPTMVEEGICKYTLDCYGPRALLGPSKCSQLCWVTNSSTERQVKARQGNPTHHHEDPTELQRDIMTLNPNLPKVDPDGCQSTSNGPWNSPDGCYGCYVDPAMLPLCFSYAVCSLRNDTGYAMKGNLIGRIVTIRSYPSGVAYPSL